MFHYPVGNNAMQPNLTRIKRNIFLQREVCFGISVLFIYVSRK